MISRVKETIEAVLGDLSLDSRTCFADAVPSPPDGRELIVECSDARALAEIEGLRCSSGLRPAAAASNCASSFLDSSGRQAYIPSFISSKI